MNSVIRTERKKDVPVIMRFSDTAVWRTAGTEPSGCTAVLPERSKDKARSPLPSELPGERGELDGFANGEGGGELLTHVERAVVRGAGGEPSGWRMGADIWLYGDCE